MRGGVHQVRKIASVSSSRTKGKSPKWVYSEKPLVAASSLRTEG